MAASQGRSSDPCRTNAGLVYVSLSTKTESTSVGPPYIQDVQPRCSPVACANADAAAP